MSLTTDPNDPKLKEGQKNETGQHEIYLVLSEEERAKGFVQPVRKSYVHVGRKTEMKGGTIEPLPKEEAQRYGDPDKYVAFLRYPKSESPLVGKALTQEEVDNMGKYIGGCGTVTTMGQDLSETYARDPKFYGSTYCYGCGKHLPVDEFVWKGTTQKVGSLQEIKDDMEWLKDQEEPHIPKETFRKEIKDLKETFRKEIEDLINGYSLENGSNTPDFILAEYLTGCLENFDKALQAREKWWGREIDHKVEEK